MAVNMDYMKLKSLKKIVGALKDAFKELDRFELQDRDLRHRYAEYYVALELLKKGHAVQLLGSRVDTNADIYLPSEGKRIEIKSGKRDKDNWSYASFTDGNQILKSKFDYCVFVTFECDAESISNVLVFTREELVEVANHRKHVARHEKTNPCLFIYASDLRGLMDWTKELGIKAYKIEKTVHTNPKRFKNAWHKIR
jgi:hypothetical protein